MFSHHLQTILEFVAIPLIIVTVLTVVNFHQNISLRILKTGKFWHHADHLDVEGNLTFQLSRD